MILEWNKSCIELIALYVHPKNGLRSHLRAVMALDHSRLSVERNSWKTIQAEFFAFDKFTLQTLANKSGCVQTNLLYFKYTSHLRRKSTMRRCFYHTDLVKNAVVHNFSRQIAFIQYSGPSKHAWTFSETVQKISKITYTASRF